MELQQRFQQRNSFRESDASPLAQTSLEPTELARTGPPQSLEFLSKRCQELSVGSCLCHALQNQLSSFGIIAMRGV